MQPYPTYIMNNRITDGTVYSLTSNNNIKPDNLSTHNHSTIHNNSTNNLYTIHNHSTNNH